MSNLAQYTIGAEVVCSDGVCGNLVRVVIDPVARTLTHLVVEPKHQQGQGRLVPIDLVDASAQEIRLRCSATDFDALDHAEATHFVPDTGEQMGYGAGQTLALLRRLATSTTVSEDYLATRRIVLPMGVPRDK